MSAEPKRKATLLENTIGHFQEVAREMGLADHMIARLGAPREVIQVNFDPVLADDNPHHFTGYIVRHSQVLGPCKGGIRMMPDVTVDDVTALAMDMTWKTALVGTPFGGGKSGIVADARQFSPADKEKIVRSFTRAALRHISPETYVPAPDMGTNEEDMGHIRDCIAYSAGISIPRGCYVTGKPVVLGGIQGRREATGRGVVVTTLAALKKMNLAPADCRVAVQGFGNVGAVAAQEMAQHGARVVAVSDITACVVNPDGLDIEALNAHVKETGGVEGFAGGDTIDREAVFEQECEVLIPAAVGNCIDEEVAGKIKARLVAEAANGPTTPEGDAVFKQSNIVVIPDILCNAGGVFVSYLEYTQETQRDQMPLEVVQQRLTKRMEETFEKVWQRSAAENASLRRAALHLAVDRVAEGTRARGMLP